MIDLATQIPYGTLTGEVVLFADIVYPCIELIGILVVLIPLLLGQCHILVILIPQLLELLGAVDQLLVALFSSFRLAAHLLASAFSWLLLSLKARDSCLSLPLLSSSSASIPRLSSCSSPRLGFGPTAEPKNPGILRLGGEGLLF